MSVTSYASGDLNRPPYLENDGLLLLKRIRDGVGLSRRNHDPAEIGEQRNVRMENTAVLCRDVKLSHKKSVEGVESWKGGGEGGKGDRTDRLRACRRNSASRSRTRRLPRIDLRVG